jgi:membrane-associated phospholipid phosphatase
MIQEQGRNFTKSNSDMYVSWTNNSNEQNGSGESGRSGGSGGSRGSKGSNDNDNENTETESVVSTSTEYEDDMTQIKNNPSPIITAGFVFVISLTYFLIMRYYKCSTFQQTFIEQDPSLSYPYVEDQQVSFTNLVILSSIIPQAILILSYAFFVLHKKNDSAKKETSKGAIFIVMIYIGFGTCMMLTSAITNTLKINYGEPRPNFFGLCNYKGYRDALSSGNYTAYYESTMFGQFGDTKNCQEDQDVINDAFMSFPSGHASLMFAGSVYPCLIFLLFKNRSIVHYMLGLMIIGGYISLASWVCITRVTDYMHRPSDVSIGAILGSLIAYIVYKFVLDILKSYKTARILKLDTKEQESVKDIKYYKQKNMPDGVYSEALI